MDGWLTLQTKKTQTWPTLVQGVKEGWINYCSHETEVQEADEGNIAPHCPLTL